VEYFVYEDEGHSLFLPANKFHFYAKAEEFLARHLGGRFELMDESGASAATK
jgi:dipeptidyl aminopeptidase/acylaminoacyl peptidase